MKKITLLFSVVALIGACGPSKAEIEAKEKEKKDSLAQAAIEKYLGYWQRIDNGEVIRIFGGGSYIYQISDGEQEREIYYNSEENTFSRHQTENDIIIYLKNDTLQWALQEFGASKSEVLWKYIFLKK